MELLLEKEIAAPKRLILWEEFRDMDFPEGDTSIYELIHGQILKRKSPNAEHQAISFKLAGRFGIFNLQKKVGSFFAAPLDVFLDEYTAGLQPDLIFVSTERDFIIQETAGIVGAPDLIVEIVSKGTVDRDRDIKKDVYEQFATKEYWIVDAFAKTVEVHRMQDNRYKLFSFAEEKGVVKSSVLAGFELEVERIFL